MSFLKRLFGIRTKIISVTSEFQEVSGKYKRVIFYEDGRVFVGLPNQDGKYFYVEQQRIPVL